MSAVTRYCMTTVGTGGFMRSTIERAIEDGIRVSDREGLPASVRAYHFPSPLSEWGGERTTVATILPPWPAGDDAPRFQIGDRVAFSAVHLRSIGPRDAGKRCAARGIVTGFAPDWPDLAEVDWIGVGFSFVNIGNLIHIDDICRDATTADTRAGHGPQEVGK